MNFVIPKLRPIVKIHGGKSYLARRIIKYLPDDTEILVSPFCGAGSVIMNTANVPYSIMTDVNRSLIELFWQIKFNLDRFLVSLSSLSYNEETFIHWRDKDPRAVSPMDAALRTYVVHRMSRGGLGKNFAWSKRLRGGKPGDQNAWETMLAHLPLLNKRLQKVRSIGVQDACVTIGSLISTVSNRITIYCDPPYLPETRTAKKVYGEFEMTVEQHGAFLDMVTGMDRSRFRILISGYDSEMYRDRLDGWRNVMFDLPNNSGQGKTKERRTEMLWMNF